MSFRNYYDASPYSRSRDTSRGTTSSTSDRPTTVTAKYINTTPSYKSSNIPVLSSTPKDESPISAIANKYANYNKTDKTTPKYDYGKTDKAPSKYDTYSKTSKYDNYSKTDKSSTSSKYETSKYEKKDYSKLSVPSVTGKSRDVSPVSTTSKYSYNRPSRHLSPERRAKSFKDKSRDPSPADRDKDIPSKTDKSSGYNSLSSYKLYSRTSNYARPATRAETKPDISLNRYTVSNRLSSNYLRSPPTVKRTSVSPVNHSDTSKSEIEKSVSPIVIVEEVDQVQKKQENESPIENGVEDVVPGQGQEDIEIETEIVTVITRHTSPTPPGSSAYVRSRRADMAKTIEKSITRPKKRPEMIDREIQSDRLDDPTRSSRYAGTTRASMTNWSYYSPNSYTGYAGRYSTQYSNLRENSASNSYNERSSRSRSSEPQPVENCNSNSLSENNNSSNGKPISTSSIPESNQEIVAIYEPNKNDEMPDIIINVNLKLKRATSPIAASAELVSPEVTITNSQLPPQAPKLEGVSKPKKIKTRKSNTDSSDSGTKKKVVKKRSKSVSSTDSDQGSETSDKNKCQSVSPPKVISKTSSGSNLTNGLSKMRHSKSRESNSPESSITLSTQSSISEDEPMTRSKTNELSRTSADETSIPTDRSMKQSSPLPPQKNDPGTEEAKSFLIRALAPVTNLFKIRHQESNESSRPENSSPESTGKDVSNLITESDKSSKSKNIVASNDDHLVKLKSIRPIESGEIAWWMDSESEKRSNENRLAVTPSDKSSPRKIRHIESGERAWWLESNSESKSENQILNNNIHSENSDSSRHIKNSKFMEEEKPWWLDSSANIPEGVERLSPPRKSSSDSEKSEKFNFYKVRHIESGEKDWWLTSNENSSHTNNKSEGQNTLSKSGSDQKSFPSRRIRHVESGERPWWLSSDKNIPEGIEKLPTPPPQPESDSSDSEEVQVYVPPSHIPPFPLHLPDDEPLGDRRSPEGLETPKENEDYRGRTSPYENNRQYRRRSLYQKGMDRYISRYTDIDDILGTSGQIYSPFMDILARRTGQIPFDDDECEEIDPTQVRIHDSTAQMPVIKKIRGRNEVANYRDEDELDDATLQVFKDGDYGPYLDLDSTLGEQDEELEGLQDKRVFIRDEVESEQKGDMSEDGSFTRSSVSDESNRFSVDSGIADDETFHQLFMVKTSVSLTDDEETMSDVEELVDFRKNSLVLRTQLPVRVHAIIEKLLHSQGRELRRALFSLKQIMQSDKDLVHDFVANKGLDCLMQVGNMENQNYIDYILRALGQILLYVDGMHGVMAHKRCVQWLYSLISSKFRYVVKTALKLLVVFVEYNENNSLLLIDAIHAVDSASGQTSWYNVMKILQDIDASDTELLIYATTLINICLNNVMDRDMYYDQIDALQEQGMDDVIQLYMTKQGTDLDLLRQLQIFDAVLLLEDGDESGTALKQLDESIINSVKRRSLNMNSPERRRSKRHQMQEKAKPTVIVNSESKPKVSHSHRTQLLPSIIDNNNEKELSSALKRRRDRYARQAHHIIQQEELLNNSNGSFNGLFKSPLNGITTNNCPNGTYINNNSFPMINGNNTSHYNSNGVNSNQEEDMYINRAAKNLNLTEVLKNGNQRYTTGLKQRIQNGTLGHSVTAVDTIAVIRQKQIDGTPEVKDDRGFLLHREHTIKDIAQRLTSPVSPTTEDKPLRVAEMTGIVSKAKEELAKSQSKEVIKSPSIEKALKIHEIKVSENELHWEELRQGCLNREFHLCDLDFSDLRQDSDDDMLSPVVNSAAGPPPPPPGMFLPPVCSPPPLPGGIIPPQLRNNVPAPPPKPSNSSELSNDSDSSTIKKNKKTVKLFWREVQENPVPTKIMSKVGGFIWDDLPEVPLDTKTLEHLFESRTNDLIIKKLMEPKRNLILDTKRSNAINIAMKKLPTPQTIKAAIMKMDATVVGREGIEKLLTMLPTEEEKIKIQEAQYANPDLPLGSAEQFLLTLASINELSSRLKLWVFKLDFDNSEKEIAEPLMDLKQGMELLKVNRTFKVILATLRSVGSFLNGSQVKGFRLEYLSKVMEVKDTVHKHPLLHHICEMIIEKFTDTTDFFSEVGPVIRASKVDFDILDINLKKLESDCKASWDHMKRIAKHDGSQIFKTKINEFLTDAAERIILLTVIRKRVMSRYSKFLLYLGVPPCDIGKTKPSEFLKVIAEFALEYRTTRERVLQQLEKRANHRERNKTRGKMIIDVGNYNNKMDDHSADRALKELLKTGPDADSLTERRRKIAQSRQICINGELNADDEIIESLVRSATTKRKPVTRERRRNRLSDRKNFNRTLDGQQGWPITENTNGSSLYQNR